MIHDARTHEHKKIGYKLLCNIAFYTYRITILSIRVLLRKGATVTDIGPVVTYSVHYLYFNYT
jgi:hypothetical protein